jgi:GT2 family glycosyltransferase
MQDATQGISVILPNYNGRGLLERNLPSIFTALHNAAAAHQVIVVDDCSSDDSVKFLQREYPQVVVVRNETNLGFSATCNRGIYAATLPLLCVVNTDVTFSPDYFQQALPHFTDPMLFSVKGAIINYREQFTEVVNTEATSELYFKRGFLRFNQRVEPQPDQLNGEVNGQFTLLGCCFVCRREMMLQLNGFDEVYSPFYWEDADLALRALRSGFRQVYEPRCTVYHQTSATIATHRSNRQRRLVSTRNKFIFTWRHLHGINHWSRHLAFTLLSLLGRWIILDWKYYVAFANAITRITRRSISHV